MAVPVLENVHIMELDRATSRLELVRVNPTRRFMKVDLDATGHWISSPGQWIWQNGNWFDAGENWIEDESQVPQRFRDEIAAVPVTAGQPQGPAVTAVCKYCGERMNQSEVEQHYVKHITDIMQATGTKPSDLVPSTEPAPKQIVTPKNDANQRRRE